MNKLNKILDYVVSNNNFYKTIISNENINDITNIKEYPVLERKTVQENKYNMFSKGYKTKYYLGDLKRRSSSGSSGEPITIFWSQEDYLSSVLSLWRKRYCYYKIKPND